MNFVISICSALKHLNGDIYSKRRITGKLVDELGSIVTEINEKNFAIVVHSQKLILNVAHNKILLAEVISLRS